ncbi:MAG: winged helix-turn-helix domain-containing protein [Nanoarchaeota archaeon]
MYKINEYEEKIIKELIKNPRISDNAISKKTKIPVMTVNRKRKKLEENNLISYYTDFCHGEKGINDFFTKELFLIKFNRGITRDDYLNFIKKEKINKNILPMYVAETYLGEKDGCLSLILIINSKNTAELIDFFNSTIINMLKKQFGKDCILDVITTKLTDLIRVHHNYMPNINMKKGIIDSKWPDDWIFVTRNRHKKILK